MTMGVLGSISLSEMWQRNLGFGTHWCCWTLSGNFPSSNHYITLLHTGGYHYLQLRSLIIWAIHVKEMWYSTYELNYLSNSKVSSIRNPTHCLYLILNTQETSHFYWHQFWGKNDGENICHWNYFQIPRALSELPANWPGRFSQKGWLGLSLGYSEWDTSSVTS